MYRVVLAVPVGPEKPHAARDLKGSKKHGEKRIKFAWKDFLRINLVPEHSPIHTTNKQRNAYLPAMSAVHAFVGIMPPLGQQNPRIRAGDPKKKEKKTSKTRGKETEKKEVWVFPFLKTSPAIPPLAENKNRNMKIDEGCEEKGDCTEN